MNEHAAGEAATPIEDREREARSLRRLLRSFGSTGSYGLVLVMIVVTYALAATLSGRGATTILLFTQMATVWQALRISVARRGLRFATTGLFILTTIAAVANLFAADHEAFVALAFTASATLYFVAPFSIVRHVGWRRTVDQETLLGALAGLPVHRDGLRVRLSAARCGAVLTVLRRRRRRYGEPGPVLQLHHAHDHRLRQPRPSYQSWPEPCGAGGPHWPVVPGDRGRQGRERLAPARLAAIRSQLREQTRPRPMRRSSNDAERGDPALAGQRDVAELGRFPPIRGMRERLRQGRMRPGLGGGGLVAVRLGRAVH